jgi:hypothetical protein
MKLVQELDKAAEQVRRGENLAFVSMTCVAAGNALANTQDMLNSIIDAWEKLPEGKYNGQIIQNWLVDDMAPAMARARNMLGRQ